MYVGMTSESVGARPPCEYIEAFGRHYGAIRAVCRGETLIYTEANGERGLSLPLPPLENHPFYRNYTSSMDKDYIQLCWIIPYVDFVTRLIKKHAYIRVHFFNPLATSDLLSEKYSSNEPTSNLDFAVK